MADRRALDAAARAQGFANYDQWNAWDQRTRGVVLGENPGGQPPPQNWLQNLLAKIPWHPSNTMGYVERKVSKALKK